MRSKQVGYNLAKNQIIEDEKQEKVFISNEDDPPPPYHSPNRASTEDSKIKRFFRKYFLEGQKLSESHASAIQNLSPDAPWHEKLLVGHRRLVGVLIPLIFFQTIWWSLAIKNNFFAYFPDRYLMSITMIFGATVGGMTSEGGGAVAFPVMTLALRLTPEVARDFSLMIQSCGMTSAAFAIIWMKIQVEWHSIIFCSFGAIFGLVFGLEVIDDLLSPDQKKLGFVSIWFSFAFALYLLNRQYKRKTYDTIPNFGLWQGAVLMVTGFVGGIFTALCGSGVDICSFSILSLLFRVNEKVSTPTSVVLMAINTCCGFYWREFMTDTGAELDSWKYLAVCVPVVVFFGPFGSFLSSHFHRQVLAMFIYVLDTIALVTALAVIPLTWQRGALVGGLILGGFIFFFVLSKLGEKLVLRNIRAETVNNNHDLDFTIPIGGYGIDCDKPIVSRSSSSITPQKHRSVSLCTSNSSERSVSVSSSGNNSVVFENGSDNAENGGTASKYYANDGKKSPITLQRSTSTVRRKTSNKSLVQGYSNPVDVED